MNWVLKPTHEQVSVVTNWLSIMSHSDGDLDNRDKAGRAMDVITALSLQNENQHKIIEALEDTEKRLETALNKIRDKASDQTATISRLRADMNRHISNNHRLHSRNELMKRKLMGLEE